MNKGIDMDFINEKIKLLLDFAKKYEKFIKYCIIGASGVFLDLTVFYLLNKKLGIYYQFVNIFSVSCGITNNFLLNAFFNFKTRDKLIIRYIQFYAVGLVGIGTSAVLLYIFVEVLNVEVMISKGIIMVIVAVIQYLLNKTFTFRR